MHSICTSGQFTFKSQHVHFAYVRKKKLSYKTTNIHSYRARERVEWGFFLIGSDQQKAQCTEAKIESKLFFAVRFPLSVNLLCRWKKSGQERTRTKIKKYSA